RGRAADLERALVNLVENALRFSPDTQAVEVAVELEPGWVHLDVIDQGPGVSDANQSAIFARFFTTDRERNGTGLGLAIVRTVAEAHGGTVFLRSPRQPTVFRLSLPR
ncbi:MAG: sensor histidine kinase, partial [Myxococcota bacterium]